jgi:hypothetical protein
MSEETLEETAYFKRIDKVWETIWTRVKDALENTPVVFLHPGIEVGDIYLDSFTEEFGTLSGNITGVLHIMADMLQFTISLYLEPLWWNGRQSDIDWEHLEKIAEKTVFYHEERYSDWTGQELYDLYTSS